MTGWDCPKCGRVFAPSVQECWSCNAKESEVSPSLADDLEQYRELQRQREDENKQRVCPCPWWQIQPYQWYPPYYWTSGNITIAYGNDTSTGTPKPSGA